MIDSLCARMEQIDAAAQWRQPEAFAHRAELADRLDLYLAGDAAPDEKARGQRLLDDMAACDEALFASLRQAIRRGEGRAALAPWLDGRSPRGQHYDALDSLLGGVLALDEPVSDDPVPPPDMVFYQPTPARHIVDCVQRAGIGAADTVLDLGSGLGHVAMLVNILSGARTLGVEREPAYVASAIRAASALELGDVRFLAADAREIGFDGVDVVYLFTPFIGRVLAEVVASLERAAAVRPLRIVTLGPCTRTFARLAWLQPDGETAPDRIVVFRSRAD